MELESWECCQWKEGYSKGKLRSKGDGEGPGWVWGNIVKYLWEGEEEGVWGARMNADMAGFVIDMLYSIDSDLSKRKGDVRVGMKVGGI